MGRETRILLGLLGLLAGLFVGVLSLKLLVPRPPAGAGPDVHGDVAFPVRQAIVPPPSPAPRAWDFTAAPPLVVTSVRSADADPTAASASRADGFFDVPAHGGPQPLSADGLAADDRATPATTSTVTRDPFVQRTVSTDGAEALPTEPPGRSRFVPIPVDPVDSSTLGLVNPGAPDGAVDGAQALPPGRFSRFGATDTDAAAASSAARREAPAPTSSDRFAAMPPESPVPFPAPTAASSIAPTRSTAIDTGPVAGSHVAVAGDSWWTLAERAYGDGRLYRALYAWNRALDPRVTLLPGTRLDVPPVDRLTAGWPGLVPAPR